MARWPKIAIADHSGTAATLRAQPGQWGPVNTYRTRGSAQCAGSRIRRAVFHAYRPAGAFETRTRPVDDGYLLEARYTLNGAS